MANEENGQTMKENIFKSRSAYQSDVDKSIEKCITANPNISFHNKTLIFAKKLSVWKECQTGSGLVIVAVPSALSVFTHGSAGAKQRTSNDETTQRFIRR
ncbi:hypothetical protein CHS0354_008083, partial [Potamilus streckersoni]